MGHVHSTNDAGLVKPVKIVRSVFLRGFVNMWWTSPLHLLSGSSLFLPKISSQDRILQRTVEQVSRCSGDADRRKVGGCAGIVFQDGTQKWTLMQISDFPVPQVVDKLVEVFTVSLT